MSYQPAWGRVLRFEKKRNSERLSSGRKRDGLIMDSRAVCEAKARCLVVPEEEALRVQWLNDRVDAVTGYYNEYLGSLHRKYHLSEQDWEFDIGCGQFVRKQRA